MRLFPKTCFFGFFSNTFIVTNPIRHKWNICDTQHYRPNRNWVHSQRNWTAFQSYCKIPRRVSCLTVCRQNHKANTSASAGQPGHTEECMFCLNRKSYSSRFLWQLGVSVLDWCAPCRGAALHVFFPTLLCVHSSGVLIGGSSPLTFQGSSPTPPSHPP